MVRGHLTIGPTGSFAAQLFSDGVKFRQLESESFLLIRRRKLGANRANPQTPEIY
jgi:hypothetical protein